MEILFRAIDWHTELSVHLKACTETRKSLTQSWYCCPTICLYLPRTRAHFAVLTHFKTSTTIARELMVPLLVRQVDCKIKLHDLSPWANYTGRATAACRRSDRQLLWITWSVISVTDPYGRILGFLDSIRYFSIKQLLSCTHEAEWTPFQTHCFFFGSVGNRTRASGSVANNSDH
jgi:hypothetical protein